MPLPTDGKTTQTLASGIIVQQEIRNAVRFVFFDTGLPEWAYATHGGTLFIVVYRGKPYGLTCRHVLKDFDWHQLIVTDQRFGRKIAGLHSVAYPSQPKHEAIDTDVLDVAVIQFSDDVSAGFFLDAPYILDEKTVATSKSGDTILVAGALKTPSSIGEDKIAPIYCVLQMVDDTPEMRDPTLRRAVGHFVKPKFSDILGLSGSPVFNVTAQALCGLVVRGGMSGDVCTLWFVDVEDIVQLLTAVAEDRVETYYRKTVPPSR
jgi:hypothetical protein